MDEIRKINMDDLKEIIAKKGFTLPLLIKDYYLSLILYLIKDLEGIYFKGGTALNKIFLKHSRLSEDIDFSVTKDVKKLKLEISKILIDSKFFEKITYDKSVEGFLRIVVHYNLEGQKGNIFIDLNKRAKLSLKPEKHKLNHFYSSFIPEFYVNTVAEEELIAEKIGIGTSNPYYPLHVKSTGTASLLIQTSATNGIAQYMLQNDAQMWVTRVATDDSFVLRDETGTKDVLKITTGGVITIEQDQSTADTAYVANVLYNTDATPPMASTVPIGTLYVQYTA